MQAMTGPRPRQIAVRPQGAAAADGPTPVDWEAAIRLPAFAALLRSRRRFIVPAATGALVWITAWLLLVGYAHRFMGRELIDGVSVMLVTGLSQFVVVWVLAVGYLRRARNDWAPLQRRPIAELEASLGCGRA